ncbi:MAG: hypothetical protein WCJ07_05105 [Verrucomicrobiota bacterium]
MTLLQTRVDDQVASQFRQAAKARGMSKYELLGELVRQVATGSKEGWKEHWTRMQAANRKPLKQNAVLQTREDEDR